MTERELAHATAREHGWDPGVLLVPGKKVTAHGTLVRMAIARRLRGRKLSLPTIGAVMGGFHHTSVLWMLRGGRKK